MPDHPNLIGDLMLRRTKIVSEISQATSEHQRALQYRCGNEVDLLKDPESAAAIQKKSENGRNIATILLKILELEAELAQIDSEIEAALNGE